MNASSTFVSGAQRDVSSRMRMRRTARFISWIIPSVVLALMPKCPACLAAYVALGTGIGLSLPAAENLRLGLLVLSGALLGALVIHGAVRFCTMHRITAQENTNHRLP